MIYALQGVTDVLHLLPSSLHPLARMLGVFLCLLLSNPSWANPLFGADEEETTEAPRERQHLDEYQQLLQALRQELRGTDLLELPLPSESDTPMHFLTLYIEALSASPKGQIILLPADGYHPDWPRGIAPLRRQLPEYGWHSYSLSLPLYQASSLPERTLPPGPLLMRLDQLVTETSTEAEQANNDPFAPAEEESSAPIPERPDPTAQLAQQREQVEARLRAVLSESGTRGRTVLVLQGQSVFWLQPWLESGGLPSNAALILLQVEVPAGAEAASLRQTLAGLTRTPLLDLYDPRHAEQQAWATERQAIYRRLGYERASQLPIHFEFGRRAETTDHWIVQRVEGWLRSL